jgi:hypothetical protein
VTRGFFEAMGLRPQAGRLPTDEELTALATDEKPTMINLFVQFDARGSMDLRLMLSLLSSRYPMFRVRSAESVVATLGDSIRNRRFQTLIFSAFGLAAVLIVGVGVLGLVSLEAHEMAILRMVQAGAVPIT